MAERDVMARWPGLPLAAWRGTRDTLHMWTQMVGKTLLATCSPQNHWWHTTLRVSATGLAAPPVVRDGHSYDIAFDFVDHELTIRRSDGRVMGMPLVPRTVRSFYEEYTALLASVGLGVHLWTRPVEVHDPIRFEEDEVHREYDAAWAHGFWQVLRRIDVVFKELSDEFLGKQSPVHFFWGSFDLASTRFSGRRAPPRPDADRVTREAYSHEVISFGFWPGGVLPNGTSVDEPILYAYAVPEPPGFRDAAVAPRAARYDASLGEFVLPYQAVCSAPDPAAAVRAFCEGVYVAGASLGKWDRAELERLTDPRRGPPGAGMDPGVHPTGP